MKRNIITVFLVVLSTSLMAQPTFNLGLKAGLNNSKVTFDVKEMDAESITKYHIGAFTRLGFNRVYLQPEAYYSAKGGEWEGTLLDQLSTFDYGTLDIPLLLGLKVLDGENANLRIMAGPVFSILTHKKISGDDLLDTRYYKDNYLAFQYGLGIDLWSFFLDLKMENSTSDIYQQSDPNLDGKNKTFMISVGYKIF